MGRFSLYHLQTIEWKQSNKPENTEELYYKGNNITIGNDQIDIGAGGLLDFHTYSNIFNGKKWGKYTAVDNLKLALHISGNFILKVFSNSKCLFERQIICRDQYILNIPESYKDGILSFQIEAIDKTEFSQGFWATEIDKGDITRVRIALVMCTYHRDEYLFKNLDILQNSLPDCYSVFVVDNGNRIPRSSISKYGSRFKLFHNNNTGGSGGFTRGLIEALRDEEKWTHVHFMDDDVTIETESLKRTSTFLSLLKNEYKNYFISGAMLRMDNPWIMHESTASWDGVRIKEHKKGLDLREKDSVFLNEFEEEAKNHFAAWWYCVIPLSKEMKEDLPFPFFIYGDDIEYSLRRADGIVSLNGVCVWHEPFEKKHSAVMKSYFFCRNLMILNTLRSDRFSLRHVLKTTLVNYLVQLFVHDYLSVEFVLEAMDDYLKGRDYLLNCSNEDLLREKRALIPALIPANTVSTSGYYSIKLNDKKYKAPFYFFKKRIAAYDYELENLELRIRSFQKIRQLSIRFIHLYLRICFNFRKLRKSYLKINLNIPFWDNKNIPENSES